MSSDYQRLFSLVEDFLNGSLTTGDAELLRQSLEADSDFLNEFRNVAEADFLLIEQVRQIRGTASSPLRERSRIPVRLSEAELNDVTRMCSPCSESITSETYPFLDHIEQTLHGQDPELNTTVISPTPIPLPSTVGSFYQINPETGKRLDKKSFLFARPGILFLVSVFVFAALAILGLFRLLLVTPSDRVPKDNFQPIARLEETIDAVWSPEGPGYKRGQDIGSNKLFLKSGLARLRFKNGAILILEGPTEFVINGSMSSFCSKGKVSVRIPKEAVGVEIVTPLATVTDHGTEFFLVVNDNKAEVSVIKGAVSIAPPNQSGQTFTEKMASHVDLSMAMSPIAFDPHDYFTSEKFEVACQDYSNKKEQEENAINSMLNGRADMIARYDYNRSDIETVPNAATGSKSIRSAASAFGATSCEGTRYGSRAAQLNQDNSRIDIPVPGTFRDMTLFLAIRPDKLDRTGSILLSTSDDENMTSFVLQIFYDGALKFRIKQPGGSGYKDLISKPFFFRTNYGTWYDFAVVIDSQKKTLSLFADGEQLVQSTYPDLKPIELSSITIGNSTHKVTKGETRFNGVIGDFMIFDTALSQENLQQIRKQ